MDDDALNLRVDAARYDAYCSAGRSTGIYVRAKLGRNYDSFDIACLTYDSLMTWLKSRGGDNQWAENTVALILGHKIMEKRQDALRKLAE